MGERPESSEGRGGFFHNIEEGQELRPFETQDRAFSNERFAISVAVEIDGVNIRMNLPITSGSLCFEAEGLTDQVVTLNAPRINGLASEIKEFVSRKVRIDSTSSTKIYGVGDDTRRVIESLPNEQPAEILLDEILIEDRKEVKYKKAEPMILTREEAKELTVNVFDLPSFT